MNRHPPISMQAHYRRSCRFIILLCIAAFGPYVIPQAGVRVEHFVIYGSFLYVLIFRMNVKWDKNIFLLMALWLAVLFWILAVSLRNLSWAPAYSLGAALDNFIQPIALITVICAAVARLDRAGRLNLLRVAGIAVIAMLCLNSFISILSVFYNTEPFLQYFVVLNEAGCNVMQSAVSMGRFSGIFNQPFENGVAYSIGLLAWVYLATTSRRISSIGWIALILLIIGGFLSVSKVFILGGFPLSMLYWFWIALSQGRIRKSTLLGGIIWGLAGVAGINLLTESWFGLEHLLRLFNLDSINADPILLFTGGRFGAEAPSVTPMFAEIWSESPVIGFGVPLQGPAVFDNECLEFFTYGGIVGIAFYIAILAVIFRFALHGLRTDPEPGRLLMALWILIVGAGLGAPVLTINRASILLWVILVIILGVLPKGRYRPYPDTHTSQD